MNPDLRHMWRLPRCLFSLLTLSFIVIHFPDKPPVYICCTLCRANHNVMTNPLPNEIQAVRFYKTLSRPDNMQSLHFRLASIWGYTGYLSPDQTTIVVIHKGVLHRTRSSISGPRRFVRAMLSTTAAEYNHLHLKRKVTVIYGKILIFCYSPYINLSTKSQKIKKPELPEELEYTVEWILQMLRVYMTV